jgi:hypothetical protein
MPVCLSTCGSNLLRLLRSASCTARNFLCPAASAEKNALFQKHLPNELGTTSVS